MSKNSKPLILILNSEAQKSSQELDSKCDHAVYISENVDNLTLN